jgi:hypothetical protein
MTMFGNAIGLSPANLGMRLFKPKEAAAPAANWWDPNNEGLPVVGAYRAIATGGSPWGNAPSNYAESLQNWANPGVYDLVEGNGAVPWAANTGWQFVAAATQYLDTGIVPVIDQTWSAFVQYNGYVSVPVLIWFGVWDTAGDNGAFIVQDQATKFRVWNSHSTVSRDNAPGPPIAANYGFSARQPYRDGVAEPLMINVAPGTCSISVFIGCVNLNGVPGLYVTSNIESWVVYSGTLTAPQVTAVTAAMAAL